MDDGSSKSPRDLRIPLAMTCIYLIWGCTYLGMKVALESFPPFLLASIRCLTAGLLLYAYSHLKGASRPKLREWLGTAAVGILLLTGGNGAICWAEQYVPSGFAAVSMATMPFWVTLMQWLIWRGKRPNRQVMGGILLGFLAILLMTWQSGQWTGGKAALFGSIACLAGTLSWSFGSTL